MFVKYAEKSEINEWMSLVEVVRDNFPGLDEIQYREGLEKSIENREALTAWEGDVLIGVLAFSKASAELEFLAVHPKHRRKGAAKALFEKMLQEFKDGNEISVVTYCEGDEIGASARKLYFSLGFGEAELLTVFDYPCQRLIYIA
ncbi:hypothetical protein SDC9_95534 [bioreactor metagenome]|uniref:N-acetyltransferase domain-containing protein n=1 Tax=bioreactor metagenome TaxID=1076179 RepID=A0A645A6W9_9ZZZZ|nr:GNAT family N-acetyltransferase [Candidatus Metalachnospira sp.]